MWVNTDLYGERVDSLYDRQYNAASEYLHLDWIMLPQSSLSFASPLRSCPGPESLCSHHTRFIFRQRSVVEDRGL